MTALKNSPISLGSSGGGVTPQDLETAISKIVVGKLACTDSSLIEFDKVSGVLSKSTSDIYMTGTNDNDVLVTFPNDAESFVLGNSRHQLYIDIKSDNSSTTAVLQTYDLSGTAPTIASDESRVLLGLSIKNSLNEWELELSGVYQSSNAMNAFTQSEYNIQHGKIVVSEPSKISYDGVASIVNEGFDTGQGATIEYIGLGDFVVDITFRTIFMTNQLGDLAIFYIDVDPTLTSQTATIETGSKTSQPPIASGKVRIQLGTFTVINATDRRPFLPGLYDYTNDVQATTLIPTQRKQEILFQGVADTVQSGVPLNIVDLINDLDAQVNSGTGTVSRSGDTTFLNATSKKLNVFPYESNVNIKVDIAGDFVAGGQRQAITLNFTATPLDSVSVDRNTAGKVNFITFLSPDTTGNLVTNGTDINLVIDPSDNNFNLTDILIIITQKTPPNAQISEV